MRTAGRYTGHACPNRNRTSPAPLKLFVERASVEERPLLLSIAERNAAERYHSIDPELGHRRGEVVAGSLILKALPGADFRPPDSKRMGIGSRAADGMTA
jgi:hypothetical protein